MTSVLQTRPNHSRTAGEAVPAPRLRSLKRQAWIAEVAELRREHDELRRTLYDAAQVQRRLCGPRKLERGDFQVACELFPLRHLSGDFISVAEVDGEIFFALGDIAGKGIAAAMWFGSLLTLLRLSHARNGDPAAALETINRDLMQSGLEPPLASLFLGRLNPSTGTLTYCNAGHPAPLVLRESMPVQNLATGGPILGAIANARYANGIARLEPGDLLLVYSDGIPECRNTAGAEFGMRNLMDAATSGSMHSAESVLFSVLAATSRFSETQPREDDMAILAIHRGSEPGAGK